MKKQDNHEKGFDLPAFRRKHFAHFATSAHVSQCTCDPSHPDLCPFKVNFGSNPPPERKVAQDDND